MKEIKPILFCDMDGVICHCDKRLHEIDVNLKNIENEEERSKRVDQIFLENPYLFHDLEPMPDAIESVSILMEYYDVYFLSTPVWDVALSWAGKRIWIEKYFGEKAHKRLILSHRKDLCIGDYLIDDRTKNGAGEFKGYHIHFGQEKFPDWKSVLKYLIYDNYDIMKNEIYKTIPDWSIKLAKNIIPPDLVSLQELEIPKINMQLLPEFEQEVLNKTFKKSLKTSRTKTIK